MAQGERQRIVLLASVTIALAIAGFFLFRPSRLTSAAPAPSSSGVDEPVATVAAAASAALGDSAAASSAASTPPLDRAHADAIRAQLKALYGAATPPATTENKANAQFPAMPHDDNSNDVLKDYIHQRIKDDYLPLAKSCYENALAKSPTLGGKLVMSFKIVGDRRVGGVVDSAEIDPASTIHDDAFDECVKESMMAVSFDAPPDDKPVTVKYPLVFSTDPDAGGN